MPKRTIDVENLSVTWTFEDGKTRTWSYEDLPDDMRLRAALFGMCETGGNSYAGSAQQENPLQFCKEQLEKRIANIERGQWSGGSGTGGGRVDDLTQAMVNVGIGSLEQVQTMLANLSDDAKVARAEKQKYRKIPEIELEIIKIKKAREEAKEAALLQKVSEGGEGGSLLDALKAEAESIE